ncbi:hypothetical protein MRB53_010009 [Persea americana]|uniref:Uncharacterized protein n=1 Tax=Persea americana TaxID=3435 RepID=A0ACC2LQN8_PERAE|nr:hypothetical protein MRB53_010009 [Persea americana]
MNASDITHAINQSNDQEVHYRIWYQILPFWDQKKKTEAAFVFFVGGVEQQVRQVPSSEIVGRWPQEGCTAPKERCAATAADEARPRLALGGRRMCWPGERRCPVR